MSQPEQPITVELRRPAAARWAMLAAIAALCVVFLYLGVRENAVVLGILAIPTGLAGLAVWRTQATTIRFDGQTLTDDTGLVLCRVDDITAVERGIAPLKPSSGFVIQTRDKQAAGWSPGWSARRWCSRARRVPARPRPRRE